MEHRVAKITALVAQTHPDTRSVCQLGYNLGRLSEITGLGREPFRDRWKGAIEAWDHARLQILAQELPLICGYSQSSPPLDTSQPG